jgi:alkylated DNA repair dioxygenase AlkB
MPLGAPLHQRCIPAGMARQIGLFDAAAGLPEGFRYQPDLVTVPEEQDLVRRIETLPFREFEFRGFTGKRRVVSYGWRYDFNQHVLEQADDMPAFLLALRERAGAFAGIPPDKLQQALVTEYSPGTPIGWHRDRPQFGDVVGISLLSAASFRLRRKAGTKWERVSLTVEPRSAYLMRGPSRDEWEHSIPPVERLRYSVTFRNFRVDR